MSRNLGGDMLVDYKGRVVDFEYNEEGHYTGKDGKIYRTIYTIDKIEKISPGLSPSEFDLYDEEGTTHNIRNRMRNPDSHYLYVKDNNKLEEEIKVTESNDTYQNILDEQTYNQIFHLLEKKKQLFIFFYLLDN